MNLCVVYNITMHQSQSILISLLYFFLFQGIFVSDVDKQSSAHGKLSVKDKILDVDGVDFTKISLVDAETVLSNAGSIINIMISRDK